MLTKVKSDTTACYDKIFSKLASAVSQLNEMSKTVCLVYAKRLKEAKYHLKVL